MDPTKINQLLENVRRDAGGAFLTGLAYIGDRLGLFVALAEHGPVTSQRLADVTDTEERYVLEWLRALTAFGYVEHDPDAATWWLTPEQAAVLAQEDSPTLAVGTFQFALPSLLHTEELIEAFREGGGIPYENLHPEIAPAIDRMHRGWFEHQLTGSWIPAIADLDERLHGGISVLDVGCGLGRSTAALARAYPRSRITGIDPHAPSAEAAVEMTAGLPNARIEQATLATLADRARTGGETFDLVFAIDCIHDMPDPVGALRDARRVLAEDGLIVWSEPCGSSNPLQNRDDTLARVRAALSPYHCLTVSLAAGGAGLGTIIGEDGARRLADEAGFDSLEIFPVDSPLQAFYGLRR
jgi:SAM-dependent methyltransferase